MELKSVVIYPSYACNLSCSYCWVRRLEMTSATRPLQEWTKALSCLPRDSVVDIVGGEPTLLDGLHAFCRDLPGYFGMTTNLTRWATMEQFLLEPLPNGLSITCSWHNAMEYGEFAKRVKMLRMAGYPTSWSVVAPEEEAPADGAQSNPSIDLHPKRVAPRVCNAGKVHVVVAPDGAVYRCQSHQMAHSQPIGNIFDGGIAGIDACGTCDLDCVPCYKQGQFGVRMA